MLKKINWKFRKIHITISPLIIFINNTWEGWGFDLLNVKYNLSEGSLIKMTWTLPNGADKNFTFSGDFLFLRTPLLNELMDIEDSILWGNDTKLDTIKHWILTFIFK